MLYKVNRALVDLKTVHEVAQRALDLALEMEGAERGFTMLLDGDSIDRGDFSKGGYAFEPALIRRRPGAKASPGYGAGIDDFAEHHPPGDARRPAATGHRPAGRSTTGEEREHRSRGDSIRDVRAAGSRERRSGLLYVDNFSRRGMFAVEELNAFTVIATQAGYAIDRIRTHMESAEPQPSPAIK